MFPLFLLLFTEGVFEPVYLHDHDPSMTCPASTKRSVKKQLLQGHDLYKYISDLAVDLPLQSHTTRCYP